MVRTSIVFALIATLLVAAVGVHGQRAMTAEAKTMAGEFVDVPDQPAAEEVAATEAPVLPVQEVDITEVPIVSDDAAPAEAPAAAEEAPVEPVAVDEAPVEPVAVEEAPVDITNTPVGGAAEAEQVPVSIEDTPVEVAAEKPAAPADVTEVPVSAEAPVVEEAAAAAVPAVEAKAEEGAVVEATAADADVHVVEPHAEGEATPAGRKVPGDDTLLILGDESGAAAPTTAEPAARNTTAGAAVADKPIAGGAHGSSHQASVLEKIHEDNMHALKAIGNMIEHEEELVADDGSNVLGGFAGENTKGTTRHRGPRPDGACVWELHAIEEYGAGAHGWSNNEVSKCAHRQLLGGYNRFSGGEVFKVFEELPEHTHLRVRALWHFIDSWDHDTVFVKVDDHYAYTKAGPAAKLGGLNVCGAEGVADQINQLMDVSVEHTDDCAKVALGSNLQGDASHAAWGVSTLSVWTCKVEFTDTSGCSTVGTKTADGGETHTTAVAVPQRQQEKDDEEGHDPWMIDWDDEELEDDWEPEFDDAFFDDLLIDHSDEHSSSSSSSSSSTAF